MPDELSAEVREVVVSWGRGGVLKPDGRWDVLPPFYKILVSEDSFFHNCPLDNVIFTINMEKAFRLIFGTRSPLCSQVPLHQHIHWLEKPAITAEPGDLAKQGKKGKAEPV